MTVATATAGGWRETGGVRIVVLGAGAVGGLIGGRLAGAGHDVTLVARGQHLRAMQRRGLTLRSPDGAATVPVRAVGSPAEADLADGDVVVLAVKSQDTGEAVAALARVAPPGVAVVCAQNGVANERVALRAFPRVYGMVVMLPATHLEPGTVEAWCSPVTGLLDLGRFPAGVDATAEALAGALRGATFRAEARPDIMRWKYRKLLLNLANAVEAVAAADGGHDALVARAVAEGEAVLRAAGIDCASAEEDAARRRELPRIRPIAGRRRQGGSSWQSLARGLGSIETDYLNGEIVLLGRLHGVPTPTNELLQRLARQVATERRPPGSVPSGEILARLDGS
ncbi:MAG TPA: 2-dehydropantoate 2-reductase [Acidimicrobiales bacterium]